jgi:hypothetical protein
MSQYPPYSSPPTHSLPTAPHIPLPPLPPPSYSRHQTLPHNDQVTIILKFPSFSSFQWCLSLYSKVMGGVGMLFSILWVMGHGYVLSKTEDGGLRVQRYFDIFAGLSLLLSFASLLLGAIRKSPAGLIVFIVLSCGVLVTYWVWLGYLRFGLEESEASQELLSSLIVLSVLYLLLLLPVLPMYNYLEEGIARTEEEEEQCKVRQLFQDL